MKVGEDPPVGVEVVLVRSGALEVVRAIHANMPCAPQRSKVFKKVSRHSTKILRTLVLKKF